MAYKVLPQHRVSNFDPAALKKRINAATNHVHRKKDGTFKVSKRGKYNAKGRWVDHLFFPSKAEADRYEQLREMEQSGKITELEVHPRYPLKVNNVPVGVYIADFSYRIKPHQLGSRVIIEDVKGVITQLYALKRRLAEALYPIKIFEVKLPKLRRGKGTWHGSVERYRFLTADELGKAPKEMQDDDPARPPDGGK